MSKNDSAAEEVGFDALREIGGTVIVTVNNRQYKCAVLARCFYLNTWYIICISPPQDESADPKVLYLSAFRPFKLKGGEALKFALVDEALARKIIEIVQGAGVLGGMRELPGAQDTSPCDPTSYEN